MPPEPELKTIIPVPGMKQGLESRLAPEGTLTYAQNVRFDKVGRIAKRGGSALIGTDLPAPTTGGAWVHEDFACIDDAVYGYDSTAATWLARGAELGTDHPFYPVGRFPAVLTETGVAVFGGAAFNSIAALGTTLIIATSGAGGTTPAPATSVVALDDSGRVLWRLAAFAGHRPRFVLAGGVLYLLTMTNTFGLEARTLTASGTLSGATSLVSAAGVAFFDAAPLALTNDWVLAYHNGGNITVARYSGTFSSASRTITTTDVPEQIGVAGGGATNDTIWVVWHDNANGLLYSPNKWDLSAAWMTTALAVAGSATAAPSGQPSVIRTSATEAIIACTFALVSASPISLQNPTVHTRYVDNSGGAGTTVKHHGWQLASKPWPAPASSVSPRRVRYLVAGFYAPRHGILELGTDAEGGSIVGLSSERDAGVTEQLTDAVVYDPGSGDSRVATVATWVPRIGVGSILYAADLLVLGARHLGNGSRFTGSAARAVHRGPFAALNYVAGGASLVEIQPVPPSSSRRLPHNGFALLPFILGDAQSGGSLTASTAYAYRATYEQLDTAGQRCRSEASVPITITTDASNKTARIHATVPGGTSRPNVTLHLWRSWNGGPYYRVTPDAGAPLCTDSTAQPTGDFVTYNDTLSDANASLREELDTQSVANAPPSGGRIAAMGGGRMFVVDWMGRVQVSKLIVLGEPVQFVDDDAFRIFPREPPTGLAALDGALVILLPNGIDLVSIGVGPTDAGQNPYDVPQAIPTDAGCVDWRSVLVTSKGVLYQSRQGIMLLPRGFGLPVYVSDDMSEELEARPYVLSAARSVRPGGTELAHFLISTSEQPETGGRLLTLDLDLGAWSVDVLGEKVSALGTRRGRLVYVVGAAVEDAARWLPEDDSTFANLTNAAASQWIEMRLRFAQLRPFGIAGQGRFERAVALVEAQGSSTIEECAFTAKSTLDEGVGVNHQPETRTIQVADTLKSAGAVAGQALYFGADFRHKTGTSLELEYYDAAPDAEGVFTRGVVFHGLMLEVQAEGGLRRLPKEFQR